MCEEVKDLLAELRDEQEEQFEDEDFEEELDDEDIDEEEDKIIKGFMAKDIKLYKDGNEITINETQLDNFISLGWKQEQDKQSTSKKETKNGNTSRKRRSSKSWWNWYWRNYWFYT